MPNMIIATYNIANSEPTIRGTAPGKRKWLVKLYVSNGVERIDKQLRNQQPIALSALIDLAQKELNQMWQELPGITDAGFAVHLLR